MPSVYSAFTNPTGLPPIDSSQLMQEPAVYRDRLGPHVTLIKTENLPDASAQTATNVLNTFFGKLIEYNAATFTIVRGALLENDVEDDIQEGKYVYILRPSSNVLNGINRAAKYLKENSRIRITSIGYGGSFHMSMYYKPVQIDQQQILENLMNGNANQEISFGNAYVDIDRKRSSMNKVSFSKVGVVEYRAYLSSISERDLVDIFVSDNDEEGIDEFGDKTSSAMLAADELLLRSGVIIDPEQIGSNSDEHYTEEEIRSMKNYASHMQRIASERGIVSEPDDGSLFR